jgi:hypothetical protein
MDNCQDSQCSFQDLNRGCNLLLSISKPYKTTGKIIVLYKLISTVMGKKQCANYYNLKNTSRKGLMLLTSHSAPPLQRTERNYRPVSVTIQLTGLFACTISANANSFDKIGKQRKRKIQFRNVSEQYTQKKNLTF